MSQKVGTFLTMISLAIWMIVMIALWSGADRIAAMLILPIWLLAIIATIPAFIAWLWARAWLGFGLVLLWALTIVMISDIFQGIGRIGLDQDPVRVATEQNAWRIITIDCKGTSSPPAPILENTHPDVIFLQNLRHIDDATNIAHHLFGTNASIRTCQNSAIIVRHGQLGQAWPILSHGSFIVDWSPHRTVIPVRLVNINLDPIPTNRNLLSPECWKQHSYARAIHRHELAQLLEIMKNMGRQAGERPVICAGAFNSPSSSPVFQSFLKILNDAYETSGVGYGATFPASFPLLRLHRITYTSPLRSIHSSTLDIPGLDAHAVMADIKPQ